MKRKLMIVFLVLLTGFLVWRFVRPMNIFIVSDRFAWPVDTSKSAGVISNLSAVSCGRCHPAFYREWKTTIHSRAWLDSYFQADWQFDGSQANCRLCHTPLDKQQPQTVLAYRDADKWDPVLKDNPSFDQNLQHQGVTCAACHYREGKIVGVLSNVQAPHPVKKLADPNQICVRCHIVKGKRWDTFFRFPPCGTVAEIRQTQAKKISAMDSKNKSETGLTLSATKSVREISSRPEIMSETGSSGEVAVPDYHSLGCVQCHMPVVERPLVTGGKIRSTRHHYWRGGHDPEMVKKALRIHFSEYRQNVSDTSQPDNDRSENSRHKRVFRLTITNTGAEHYLPTGTPDRYLQVRFRLLDKKGQVLDEQRDTIKRTVMWRPFIMDLWDTRLRRRIPRHYDFIVDKNKLDNNTAVKVEAVVSYHLLDEKRRQRIHYKNKTAISYIIFQQEILLSAGDTEK